MDNNAQRSHKASKAAEIITRLANDGFAVAALDGKKHDLFPVAMDPEEGRALQKWIKKEKPASVIDIGLGYGLAAINAIKALLEIRGKIFHFSRSTRIRTGGFLILGSSLLPRLAFIIKPSSTNVLQN